MIHLMPNPGENEWRCSHCHSDVDLGFEVCWQCGTDQSGNQAFDFESELEWGEPGAFERGLPAVLLPLHVLVMIVTIPDRDPVLMFLTGVFGVSFACLAGFALANSFRSAPPQPPPSQPICLYCSRAVNPVDHYCAQCSACVGRWTACLPFEQIPYYAEFFGRLRHRARDRNLSRTGRFLFWFLLLGTAPIGFVILWPLLVLWRAFRGAIRESDGYDDSIPP